MERVNNICKKIMAVTALSLLVTASFGAPQAQAHELEDNNGTSVIFHIEPDDNPVAGEKTVLNMLFSDEAGGFNVANYNLQVKLTQAGKKVADYAVTPAFFGATREGNSTIIFPKTGAYDIGLVGTPKATGITPFTLDYDVKVTNAGTTATAKASNAGKTVAILSFFSLILLGVVATKTILNGGKYKNPPKRAK